MTAKMPTMPLSMIVRESRNAEKLMDMCCLLPLQPKSRADECHDQPAGDDRTNLPGDIRARCMHEQEVARILVAAHLVDDAGRHRERGNARRTDHRVDLVLAEQVEEFGEKYAADCVKDEGDEAQREDEQRLPA